MNTAISIDNNCNFISVNRKQINKTPFTSKGIKKAQASDPIRSLEHLNQVINYVNNHNSFKDYRNEILFKLGISWGLRISDLRNLYVNQFYNGKVMYNTLHIFEQKTGKSKTINITDDNLKLIHDYIVNYNLRLDQPLFPSRLNSNDAITKSNVYRFLKQIENDLHLPYHMGTHTMRKTFAYWTIQLHADDINIMNSLQQLLNHSSLATTLCYAGITQEHLNTLYSDMNDMINGKLVPDKNDPSLERMIDAKE